MSNVSKKLNFLIVGEKPTNRKVEAAKNLKVKILDQSSWPKMQINLPTIFISIQKRRYFCVNFEIIIER